METAGVNSYGACGKQQQLRNSSKISKGIGDGINKSPTIDLGRNLGGNNLEFIAAARDSVEDQLGSQSLPFSIQLSFQQPLLRNQRSTLSLSYSASLRSGCGILIIII
ncbi:hypothetical protein NC651_014748 [Populus alba x Populus x berolinensis]|nr:hypothetical protein NC651_014748 [Populus alba x Populus x berolinensis]